MRLERVEALAAAAAPRRWPSPAAPRPRPRPRRRRRRPARRRRSRAAARRPARRASCSARGRSSGGAATVARVVGVELVAVRRSPKTEQKTASKAVTCAGSETNTARAVQYSRRRVTGRTSVERPREVGRARGRDRHAGVVQAPAERADERRQVELDRLDPERRRVSHRRARAARGRPRGSPPGPRCTSAPSPSVRSTAAASRRSTPSRLERRQPVDRLGDARRLLHVAVAHARDRVRDLHGERLRRALARGGARSPPRAAGVG